MLIIGLGNPGKEYENTRHNVGFWSIDKLASFFATHFSPVRKYIADIASFKHNSETHYLLKPMTYMNNSGDAVWAFLQDKNIDASNILVIEDDINLPVGKIRLRSNGSAGGHNGLKSIISKIGEGFWRLRIGVGLPKSENSDQTSEHEKLISHVLGEISPSEALILRQVINSVPEISQYWLSGEGNKAMNKFNSMEFNLEKM